MKCGGFTVGERVKSCW